MKSKEFCHRKCIWWRKRLLQSSPLNSKSPIRRRGRTLRTKSQTRTMRKNTYFLKKKKKKKKKKKRKKEKRKKSKLLTRKSLRQLFSWSLWSRKVVHGRLTHVQQSTYARIGVSLRPLKQWRMDVYSLWEILSLLLSRAKEQ